MSNQQINIQKLTHEMIHDDLLTTYKRYQQVNRCWRKENGEWVLRDISFIEDWGLDKKLAVIHDFKECILNGGAVFGAFDGDKLIGFSTLGNELFGYANDYLELQRMHISYEYRGIGLGKVLFQLAVEEARGKGAKKLYISAQSSEETRGFYRKIGCVDAAEVNEAIAADKPFDCQLEYVL